MTGRRNIGGTGGFRRGNTEKEKTMAEEPEVLTTTEARAGTGTHIVRYVLYISLALAAAAMIWIYVLAPKPTQQGATTTPPVTAPQ
jgi:hypothetical protein